MASFRTRAQLDQQLLLADRRQHGPGRGRGRGPLRGGAVHGRLRELRGPAAPEPEGSLG